jgi:hypothetical protein
MEQTIRLLVDLGQNLVSPFLLTIIFKTMVCSWAIVDALAY